uniref:Glycosyltransferase subfamily 4-like N-terminal domain-containing protein n=1 Tax=Candidatus Methanogaster sp. ANME-2c ERB4 TaxID=2759911 RepID=A0A7G9YLE2_9EURY|nr:hypothetical protein IMBEDNDK_00036 [Methanosarcinales archaeon ANME-2c ERB4]
MDKHILLIAFKYPPYAGVGGFRWSKLSRYLAEMGYKIHVVTVNWKASGGDTFLEEVQHSNITIHRIPSFYCHNFKYSRYKSSFTGRLKRVFRYGFLKVVDIIWYEDEAQFWGQHLLPFCKQLIKDNSITNVIATGHPFMANYWAARLKADIPEINLIQDFRDEWNDNPIRSFPLGQMAKKSLQHEIFALNNCDVVFAVSDGLMDLLSKKINTNIRKAVIPNGFDTHIYNKDATKRDFTFVYAGSLYAGREEPLEVFLKAVDAIEKTIPELKIKFYGSSPPNLKHKYAKLFNDGIVSAHPPVSPDQIHRFMHESFACLLFNARIYPFARSTKIYEYASLNRPTLCINYGGEIDALIKKHKLGISVNGDNVGQIKEEILKLYDIWQQDPGYEISPEGLKIYHYKNIAKEVEKYFK